MSHSALAIRSLGILAVVALSACFGKSEQRMTGIFGDTDGGVGSPTGPASDEIFPPALLQPYPGPPINYYDNTFLNYAQLKGKVKSVFGDDWVRDAGDQFEANIGAFGGVDFSSHFVESTQATADYLLAMDQLAKDVCGQAVANGAGPFSGVDTVGQIIDVPGSQTKAYSAIKTSDLTPTTGSGDVEGAVYDLYTNGSLTTTTDYNFPGTGSYTFTVRAHGSLCESAGPNMDLSVGGTVLHTFTNLGTTDQDYVYTANVNVGSLPVAVAFTNDQSDSTGDRNLYVTSLTIAGPAGTGTGTQHQTAALASIDKIYQGMFLRSPVGTEEADAYSLLTDLTNAGISIPSAWSGLCEGMIRAPDFLFTLSPSRALVTGNDRARLLLAKVSLDMNARLPTSSEIAQFVGGGSNLGQMVDQYLAGPDFQSYFFYKMRIRTESDGTVGGDEPGRLWTYVVTQHQPFQLLLTGDFSVDPTFAKVARDPVHGQTGVLTMKGYLLHKMGLPHFNYSARVLSDFMGYIFEVPDSVIKMRIGATAASTVDPKSICYSCHYLLTPLAFQRIRWDDNGNYSATDASGNTLDDSDRNLAADYPFKGEGMEAFSTQAARKERFARHTMDAVFTLMVGRELRYDQDERGLYKQLWDASTASNGDLSLIMKDIIESPTYQGP